MLERTTKHSFNIGYPYLDPNDYSEHYQGISVQVNEDGSSIIMTSNSSNKNNEIELSSPDTLQLIRELLTRINSTDEGPMKIRWQKGPREKETNGLYLEEALEQIIQRVEMLNEIESCWENSHIISHLQYARYWQKERMKRKASEGKA